MLAAVWVSAAGCSVARPGGESPGEAAAVAIPDRYAFDPERREWFEVVHVETSRGKREEEVVGYLYKQIRGKEAVSYVESLKAEPLGFILDGARTFRFVKERDADGKLVERPKHIGDLTLERGVARILGITSGTVELRLVTQSARARRKG